MELLRRLEAQARDLLPEATYDYFAGGAGDEVTLFENEAAWGRLWLRPRQLTGVTDPDLRTSVCGARMAAPIVLAPAAAQRLLHPDGEVAVARAAARAGLVSCLSTRATADLAEVAAAAPHAPRWFQLYLQPERDRVRRVLERVREHGFTHVLLTIDLPVPGRRERELRHGALELPPGVRVTTHEGDDDAPRAGAGERLGADRKPPIGGWAALRWSDLRWVAETAQLPVLVKGVLTAQDAEAALAHGAAGVVVSNHGARQLDGVVPTAVALPEVVEAVGGAAPVLVDGGVRSGADVARALALGADAVLIGRPYLWGLAAGGEDGVAEVLHALVDDLARTLALLGAQRPEHVGAPHVKLRAW
ncbi:alpha-hydroxy acid oxidase [Conexibacter sp. SYSU D00693]|uniref:alpha-hydroxy acid oxidase n=1 Tax=Conexibacter sp. SYSU D00693 TaxID=2812560 RepID=UPI00196ACC1D|nr:alpha-hydroxy acid oxidase [Conexibacter sp. SYSU D00693]